MKAIVAMARNRVIGNQGKIPWHLPGDLKFFKQLTTGHVVVMGRKTFESIGRPLPNRENVVLTRGAPIAGVRTIHSIAELAEYADRDIFLIGGSQVYEAFGPQCRELFLTVVDQELEGDAFFPPLEQEMQLTGILEKTPDYEIRHYTRQPCRS